MQIKINKLQIIKVTMQNLILGYIEKAQKIMHLVEKLTIEKKLKKR